MRMQSAIRVVGVVVTLLCLLAWTSSAPAQSLEIGGAYVQYRSHENETQAGYRGWIDFRRGGDLIDEGAIAKDENGVPMVQLYDPEGNLLAPQSVRFIRTESVVADGPYGDVWDWYPWGYSGFLLDLRNYNDQGLEEGTYRFAAQAADGTELTKEIYFPGAVPLTPVPWLGYSWQWDGSLYLTWGNPGDSFDEYSVVLTKGPDAEIFYQRLERSTYYAYLPRQLLLDINALTAPDPTNIRWRVQTRRTDENGMNYARSYNIGVTLNGWPSLPPPNDTFAGATVISAFPFIDEVDVSGATTGSEDERWCNDGTASVWYTFRADRDLTVILATTGSTYTPLVTALEWAEGSLRPVACYTSVFSAEAGKTYYLQVTAANYYGPPGRLVLSVDAHPPFSVSATLNPTGSFSSVTGAATVSGKLTCSLPASASVYGTVRQTVGRSVVEDSFDVYLFCDGETPWSAVVQSPIWTFAGGPAQVSLTASAWSDYEWGFVDVSQTVRLTGTSKGKK